MTERLSAAWMLFTPFELRREPTACREGRRHVQRCLDRISAPAEVTERAVLLTSEVISNALRHAVPPLRLAVGLVGDRMRVEVTDAGPLAPVCRVQRTDAIGGRGIFLVDQLSDDWGYHQANGTKKVWFEVARSASALTRW